MILIGQQERVMVVGPTEAHHCLRCQTETEFAPQLRYKMARIDLLFASPTIAATSWPAPGASTAGCWIPRPWTSSWAGCRSRGGTASACR